MFFFSYCRNGPGSFRLTLVPGQSLGWTNHYAPHQQKAKAFILFGSGSDWQAFRLSFIEIQVRPGLQAKRRCDGARGLFVFLRFREGFLKEDCNGVAEGQACRDDQSTEVQIRPQGTRSSFLAGPDPHFWDADCCTRNSAGDKETTPCKSLYSTVPLAIQHGLYTSVKPLTADKTDTEYISVGYA